MRIEGHKLKHAFLIILIICLYALPLSAVNTYAKQAEDSKIVWSKLDHYLSKQNAKIGLAVDFISYADSGNYDHKQNSQRQPQYTYRGSDSFVLMSVAKLPIAMLALAKVRHQEMRLDSLLSIDSIDLNRETHSPVVNGYTQTFDITLQTAIEASIKLSDNITTDKIIDALGGAQVIDSFLHQNQYQGMRFQTGYRAMTLDNLRSNYATPIVMNQLLFDFYLNRYHLDQYRDWLYQCMLSTPTGPKRLKALLPKTVSIAHKTGTFFTDSLHIAINDVGIIRCKKGIILISMFINDFKLSPEKAEAIMAKVGRKIYDYYN